MADGDLSFSPGDLVHARGREWIVLPAAGADLMRLRPLSGSELDIQTLRPSLELEPVRSASFAPPNGITWGTSDAALLLKDALRLSLRRGAGPFRSIGRIGFQPRAYQLVPLLMALKLDIVRLLIADDVGIGKTIEAGLILREFYDRGEIAGATILCPPHLVEQWVTELESKFAIQAAAVTAASAGRLERGLPVGESVFQAYPFTVVSLDFIKSPRRRDEFLARAQDFVIVDEAHACVARNDSRHRRFDLLKDLASREDRHLVMLTATPHSGDEQGYWNLLSLLHPDFGRLGEVLPDERMRLRQRLAAHFVQRRRVDIDAWKGQDGFFPDHKSKELDYRLDGRHEDFLFKVLDYCAEVVERKGDDARRQRLAFWGTLALMRCVGSSPAAALSALNTRARLDASDDEADAAAEAVFDSEADDRPDDDVEPGADIGDPALQTLLDMAKQLAAEPERDPKLKALTKALEPLLAAGFSPVIFCRYIATAQTVADALTKRFKGYEVLSVTGELPSEERRARVDTLGQSEKRILVATDCLSEGINLQEHFNAVIHYDLSWNPTRHQQREGRVDRFGQPSKEVRSILMYGANNPIDGAVLGVILKKAETIRKETGVAVPMPGDERSLTEALMKAVLLRRREARQGSLFDLGLMEESKTIERAWDDAAENEKKSRTVFAQNTLKPEDVLPEWLASDAALGGEAETERFVGRALRRLGAPLERSSRGFTAPLNSVDPIVRERLDAEDLARSLTLTFSQRPGRAIFVHRAHPLTSILAETFLERALIGGGSDPATLPRAGVWTTKAVKTVTTVAVLRIRHRLTTGRRGQADTLLVEEAGAIAWRGVASVEVESTCLNALALLDQPPEATPPERTVQRHLAEALHRLSDRRADLDALARERAETLASDHNRVRAAARASGATEVLAVTPVDVIGVYVLLPAEV
ncbi:MAG: DEAD/DEAH box helicase [Pseudomonadota bacterium]